MATESAKTPADIQVPVLIVGGGGAGLTCSMLLAQLGIETLLVSSLPTTSILPKAHVLNQRTMEILGDVGVAEPIYAKSTPAEKTMITPYSLAGGTLGTGLDVFNEPGSPPADEALTRRFACLRRARGAEQISQSAEKVVAEQCRA
jgi:2-polyprenyl-6-methoxyphenol hydroxylase-like FAD-dependent oxidoreductase